MYIPKHFHEQEPAELFALMERHSLATLVTLEAGVPLANHLPLIVERDPVHGDRLLGHMARTNSQWRTFADTREALAIFHGPDAYVSPSWYASQPNVPTWNYAVVHAYGRPRVIEDRAEERRILDIMSAKHESGIERPWRPEQVEEYVQRLLPAIVSFELRITRLEGKFKLSQNRAEKDRLGVMEALEHSADTGNQELAALMRARPTKG